MKQHNGQHYALIYSSLFLVMIVALLSGCPGTGVQPIEPTIRGGTDGPKQHLWQPLIAMHSEEPGYGMYTYVLFGRKLKPPARTGRETLERYERLLQAIHLSTLSKSEAGEMNKADTNVFLIPLTAETEQPTQHNYNSILSLRYLSLSSAMLKKTAPTLSDFLSTGEGPFLISTPQPLEKMTKDNIVLLFANLSTTNPAAMDEIVGAYKNRISKGTRAVERFRSLRLALLDVILDVDDNIKIVQTALAGE